MAKNELIKWLKVNKEGMIIGALVGLGVTIYMASAGMDLNMVAALGKKEGIVGHLMATGSSAKDIALTKVGTIYVMIGALIGGIMDSMFWPKK